MEVLREKELHVFLLIGHVSHLRTMGQKGENVPLKLEYWRSGKEVVVLAEGDSKRRLGRPGILMHGSESWSWILLGARLA